MAQNSAARRFEVYGRTAPQVPPSSVSTLPELRRNPSYQAFQILRFGFTVAPIIAGIDKFFNLLVSWDQYVAPVFPRILGLSAPGFMKIAGVIEIIAGIGVAFRPKIFGYVVSAWLGGIIVNLLIQGTYFDIALRDLGLLLGALALGRLSSDFEGRKPV